MLENKNILFLTHSYANFQKDQIELLAPHFNKVYVLVRYKPIAEISNYIHYIAAKNHTYKNQFDLNSKPANVTVLAVPLWYLPFDFFYKRLGNYHLRIAKNIIRKHKITFDIIHAHFTWTAGYVGSKLKEIYNVPIVLTVHEDNNTLQKELNYQWNNISFALKKANVIIRVNKNTIPVLLKYNKTILHIANGFTSSLFYEKNLVKAREELELPKDKKIITTIGWLDEQKGQKHLISAINLLLNKRKDILCFVIGIGPLFNSLQKQIISLSLQNNVILKGRIKHNDLVNWLNASNLFVLPSLSESFGVVQIEAMACGKPVVATINGGSEEIITSEDVGFLCEKENAIDLAEKLEMALNKNWVKEKILKHAQNYTWERAVKEILNVYVNLMKP